MSKRTPNRSDNTTITAYVSDDLKKKFLDIRSELSKNIRVPQTALAQFAIGQFVDRYRNNVQQLVLDLGLNK